MIERLRIPAAARQTGGEALEEQRIRVAFEGLKAETNAQSQEVLHHECSQVGELLTRAEGKRIFEGPARVQDRTKELQAGLERELATLNQREAHSREAKNALEHAAGGPIDPNASSRRLLSIALLLVLVLVESIMNGLVLGGFHQSGIAGGVTQALAISVLSIALSWFAGDALSRLYDTSALGRSLAIGGLCVFLASLLSYHTVVAWIRMILGHADSLRINSGGEIYDLANRPHEAFEWALPFALEHGLDPAHLSDLHAWFLLIVGCFFGIGAFVAGWQDRRVARQAAEARVVETNRRDQRATRHADADYLDNAVHLHHEGLAEVDRREAEALEAMSELAATVARARRIEAEHSELVKSLDNGFLFAIAYFRSTNTQIRVTPAPEFFFEAPKPLGDDGFRLALPGIAAAESLLGDEFRAVRTIEEAAQTARTEIRKQLELCLALAPSFLASFRTTPPAGGSAPPAPGHAAVGASVMPFPRIETTR